MAPSSSSASAATSVQVGACSLCCVVPTPSDLFPQLFVSAQRPPRTRRPSPPVSNAPSSRRLHPTLSLSSLSLAHHLEPAHRVELLRRPRPGRKSSRSASTRSMGLRPTSMTCSKARRSLSSTASSRASTVQYWPTARQAVARLTP